MASLECQASASAVVRWCRRRERLFLDRRVEVVDHTLQLGVYRDHPWLDRPTDHVRERASGLPEREVEGTRLLFLRLNLRIKLVEQELLSMGPDRLLEHMGVASDLLAQLRSRPLEEPEIARADNMEQYLQFLTEQYVQLHGGKAPKKKKGRK